MMSQRNKKKKSLKNFFKELLIGGAIGLVIGLIIALIFGVLGIDITQMSFLYFLLFFVSALIVSIPIHVVLHELGHVFFGWLAGFKISFLTIFGQTWVSTDEGLKTAKVWNPFALGQAGMVPKSERPKWAYALYFLGGPLFNVLWGFVFLGLSAVIDNLYLRAFLVIIAIVGTVLAVLNLWPMDQSDGMHLKRLIQEDHYDIQVYRNLKCLDDMMHAEEFSDIKQWMELDSQAPLTSLSNLTAATLKASQAACQNDFKQAARIYGAIFERKEDLFKIHQIEVMQEYLFALLMYDPNHKHIYPIKKDPLMQSAWKARTPGSYRVRAADAFYMRFDREQASEFLSAGAPLIDRQMIPFERKIERRLYDLLTERMENESLEDLKLLPKEELMQFAPKQSVDGDDQDE